MQRNVSGGLLNLAASREALKCVKPGCVLGVGSGSTVNIFISLLQVIATEILGTAAVSDTSASKLQSIGIVAVDINDVNEFAVYINGADDVDSNLMCMEGGNALTREKIRSDAAAVFGGIVDDTKGVRQLGAFALPIKVIPIATNMNRRHIQALGGQPTFRPGVKTDNGNSTVDVRGLSFADPVALKSALNQSLGVVCIGVFSERRAGACITAHASGVVVKGPARPVTSYQSRERPTSSPNVSAYRR